MPLTENPCDLLRAYHVSWGRKGRQEGNHSNLNLALVTKENLDTLLAVGVEEF